MPRKPKPFKTLWGIVLPDGGYWMLDEYLAVPAFSTRRQARQCLENRPELRQCGCYVAKLTEAKP